MKRRPRLELMPRVDRDIKQCLDFVRRQPWGRPDDRQMDIYRGIIEVWREPERSSIKSRALATGVELRRHSSAQFVIVYAYLPPNQEFPDGIVSIRAVRHRRAKNVFSSVRDAPRCYEFELFTAGFV